MEPGGVYLLNMSPVLFAAWGLCAQARGCQLFSRLFHTCESLNMILPKKDHTDPSQLHYKFTERQQQLWKYLILKIHIQENAGDASWLSLKGCNVNPTSTIPWGTQP